MAEGSFPWYELCRLKKNLMMMNNTVYENHRAKLFCSLLQNIFVWGQQHR
jgi:hypothetical protein